jgi:hypothetical protein
MHDSSILTSSLLLLLLVLVSFGEVADLLVLIGSWISVDFGMEAIAFSLFSSPTISVSGFGLFMMPIAEGYKRVSTRYEGQGR